MTGLLWAGEANPRDLTGRLGREQQQRKRQAEEAAAVDEIRREGKPGSGEVYTMDQFRAMAASGEYGEGEAMGFTPHGQPVAFYDGEPVVTDATVRVQRANA
jgi:hypothetical protein